MSVDSTQVEGESSTNNFSSGDANNFIRGNDAGCLIITEEVQGEEVETVFITVNRTYFRVKEFGTPSKVKRHTMASALETARKAGNQVELAAYPQSSLDIDEAIEFITDTFELEDKESKAGFGLSRDDLDEVGDDNVEVASKPIGTSDEHGGGW